MSPKYGDNPLRKNNIRSAERNRRGTGRYVKHKSVMLRSGLSEKLRSILIKFCFLIKCWQEVWDERHTAQTKVREGRDKPDKKVMGTSMGGKSDDYLTSQAASVKTEQKNTVNKSQVSITGPWIPGNTFRVRIAS